MSARKFRIGSQIRSRELRVIDEKNTQLGVISLEEALALARDREVDLVEMSPNAEPPVARLMDYGKYQYEQARAKGKQKKTKAGQVKEIRLSMKIGEHDLRYRLDRARQFLDDGYKVRFNLMMKGRENANPRRAMDRIKEFAELLDGVKLEAEPVRAGRSISAVVTHVKKSDKPVEFKKDDQV